MIDVILTGTYLGAPHEIGAWAYRYSVGESLLGERQGSGRPQIITSRLSTEAAALALALEEIARGWAGEDVAVRTASAGLQGLVQRRGLGAHRELSQWHSRIREAALRCSSVRILLVSAQDLVTLDASARQLLPRREGRPRLARASEMGLWRNRP